MARVVNVHEAKTHLSRLLEDVRAGEEIVVAKNGIPCAKLVPLDPPKKRRLGFVEGHIPDEFFDPLPDEDLDAWDGLNSSLGE
jgi:prevent-host-death family protein